jgi:hypothetical protein
VRATLDDTRNAFTIFRSRHQTDYAYPQLCVVAVDECPGDAQSFAGLVLVDSSLIAPQRVLELAFRAKGVLADALARAWLAPALRIDPTTEGWLREGLIGQLGAAYLTWVSIFPFLSYHKFIYRLFLVLFLIYLF